MPTRPLARLAQCLIALSLFLGASAGPPPADLATWATAVAAARDQSDTSFAAVNAFVRERQIAYAAAQPTLKEALFQPGLDSASLRAWDAALDALSSYAGNLATLTNPATFAGTGASAAAFAQDLAARAKLDAFKTRPGLATAVAQIGDVIMASASGASARAILVKADPAVQQLLTQMANMISQPVDGEETGVIPTVAANWGVRLGEIQAQYLAPNADKLALAQQYAAALASRDDSLATLRSLKSSLQALAATHAQLARGQPADLNSILTQIQQYTLLARAILTELKQTAPAAH